MANIRLLIARVFATDADRRAIDRILNCFSSDPDADVYVVLNARFLSVFSIAKRRAAISQLLQTIAVIGERSNAKNKRCAIVFRKKLNQTKSAKLVFSHHTYNEMFTDEFIAKNAVFHFKSGDLPQTMTIDRGGFAGWSSIATEPVKSLVNPKVQFAKAEAFFKEQGRKIKTENASKYRQPMIDESRDLLPEKFVFVALQTVGDIVQKNAFIDIFDMLNLVVETFSGTQTKVLLKRHPLCRSKKMKMAIDKAVSEHENVQVTEMSIHALLPNAAALFTVNSGVGSEAMIYNIPVYCFGKSDYGAMAHVVQDINDAPALLKHLAPKLSYVDLVQFHYFYRKQYQISNAQQLAERIDVILNDGSK